MSAATLRAVKPLSEAELSTARVRSFLGIGCDEPIELTAFVEGRIRIAHARNVEEHVRLLREGDKLPGCNGIYQLVNGPMDPTLLYRYEPGKWHRAWNGRAADPHIGTIRAVFLDVDPVRVKGISSTDEQLNEARDTAKVIQSWLLDVLDAPAVGFGCSGNGFFLLVALEPVTPSAETTQRLSKLLGLLNRKFGNDRIKIDTSVVNPARLMPAPGTWKRKGRNTPERPHRQTTFECPGAVQRVPLEELA